MPSVSGSGCWSVDRLIFNVTDFTSSVLKNHVQILETKHNSADESKQSLNSFKRIDKCSSLIDPFEVNPFS